MNLVGQQKTLLNSRYSNVLFKGPRGTGKTTAMFLDFIKIARKNRLCVLYCASKAQAVGLIGAYRHVFDNTGYVYNATKPTFIMPGGARLKIVYKIADLENMIGTLIHKLYIDEIAQYSDKIVNRIAVVANIHSAKIMANTSDVTGVETYSCTVISSDTYVKP